MTVQRIKAKQPLVAVILGVDEYQIGVRIRPRAGCADYYVTDSRRSIADPSINEKIKDDKGGLCEVTRDDVREFAEALLELVGED